MFLASCFSYQPLIETAPTPGDRVRVRLSVSAASQLSDWVGQPIRSVEGTVLYANPDSLRLDVGWGALFAGTRFEGRRDTLTFAERDILGIDRRELSKGRTALVGAGAVAAVVALFRGIRGGGTGTGDNGNGTTPF